MKVIRLIHVNSLFIIKTQEITLTTNVHSKNVHMCQNFIAFYGKSKNKFFEIWLYAY